MLRRAHSNVSGGRGGGRGEGRGGRGGRGSDRGGGRGGRGGRGAPQVFGENSSPPLPDPQVHKLESALIPRSRGLEDEFSKLSVAQRWPLRPGYAERGLPTVLWANYFEVLPNPNTTLYSYGVDIAPEPQARRVRSAIFQALLSDSPIATLSPGLASDFHATIITLQPLLPAQHAFQFEYPRAEDISTGERTKTYQILLRENASLTTSQLIDYITSSNISAELVEKAQLIQALNIVMNSYAKSPSSTARYSSRNNTHYIVNGPLAQGSDLGGGLNAFRGYFTSVRAAASRLLVNVQIKHTSFYKSVRLDELVNEFQRYHGRNMRQLDSFLRHLRVDRLHLKTDATGKPSSAKSICGLAKPSDGSKLENPPRVPHVGATAQQVQFFLGPDVAKPLVPSSYTTVAAFFKNAHNITTSMNLPVVNVGSPQFPTYLPLGVAQVLPAQRAKLPLSQTKDMIKVSARRPFENAKSISENGLANTGLAPPSSTASAFGLQVQPSMVTVQGRILDPPVPRYAHNQVARLQPGSWNMDGVKFSRGATLGTWTVIWGLKNSVRDPWDRNGANIMRRLDQFAKTLTSCGMRCASPSIGRQVNLDADDIDAEIEGCFRYFLSRGNGEKFILVILPEKNDEAYNAVKRCGDLKFGIHTVCVIASRDKFATPNAQYDSNVALKFNLKLGGSNQTLSSGDLGIIANGQTMVVGIDVTHPSPGSREGAPSVAAMVASISKDIAQFPAVFRIQAGRVEMVSALTEMLKTRLRLWLKHNQNVLPKNILVYRDGVSEGQYQLVLDQELPLLQQACKEMYPASQNQPAFSIIIVGKRHNVRFYPTSTNPSHIDVRSSNSKNGTVVDRGITEPRNWDFYLQAHTALQGTARPAHYFVVHDEIFTKNPLPHGFSNAAEVLQHITHNMSYMFGRATKAVSYCPPAYYADLVCERVRCYLSHQFSPIASQEGSVASDTATLSQTTQLHDSIKDSMFYL